MLNKKNGFTLLELIVSIFVIMIGVVAVFIIAQYPLSQVSISTSQLTAAYLAQEGIEIVRNIRDTNWLEEEDWDDGLIAGAGFNGCSSGYFCEADYSASGLTSYSDSTSAHKLKIDAGFYKYSPSGIETRFKREIKIEPTTDPQGEDILKITVIVIWDQKGKFYEIKAQENLYNWGEQLAL